MYVVFLYNARENEISEVLLEHEDEDKAVRETRRLRDQNLPAFYITKEKYDLITTKSSGETPPLSRRALSRVLEKEDTDLTSSDKSDLVNFLDCVLEEKGIETPDKKDNLLEYLDKLDLAWRGYLEEEITLWLRDRKED